MIGGAVAGGEAEIGWFAAVVLGLVEGITEFLPISSTGHLIVAQRVLGLADGPAHNLFAIGVQTGAITAILALYRRRLLAAVRTVLRPAAGPNLLLQIAVAAAPAAVLGLLLDDWIDQELFSTRVVSTTMVLGGFVLLALDGLLARRRGAPLDLAAMPLRVALGIGLCQCLALLPGTSRSAATIGGALLLGLSRPAAAEFSFLVGLPILYGAASLKLLKAGDLLAGPLLGPFLLATAVAFVSALVVVGPFVRWLERHTFAPFAWYRIVGGSLLGIACWRGWLAA